MINDEANNYYYFPVKHLSELNSLGCLQGKKEAIIINNNNNNFRNALDDSLNYQTIETHPKRISKLKSYINKYNWKGIDFPAESKEWQKFEKNNNTIAINILYVKYNAKAINVAYRSEHNNKRKKQVILLMINNGKKYHYLAVTNLSALLERVSSNHEEDFHCLNCFNSYTTENKLKEHEEIRNNNDSCRTEISSWAEKTLKYNPGEKSLNAPFTIYFDLECLLKKVQFCQNNPKKSYTEKKAIHEPSGWSMFIRCSFDKKENKLDYYRGKDCIEKLCKKLKERVNETINREKKEIILLTHEENNIYNEQEICYICKEKFCLDKDDKNYTNRKKVKDHCHYTGKFRGAAHSICNLKHKVPKEIPIIIHNAS